MANPTFSVYSLADVETIIQHKNVGKCILSKEGGGRITISYSGDLSSVTTTATGFPVINKLVAKNGSIGLEVPVNSNADIYMRKWCAYLKKAKTSEFALSRLELADNAAGRRLSMTGVVPQKEPDEAYDQTAGNRMYNLFFAELTTTSFKAKA